MRIVVFLNPVKMVLKETRYEDGNRIEQAQNLVQWRSFLKKVMHFRDS
jgi:hypothetical protein